MKQKIYQFLFTKVFGWKVVGTIQPEIKKCIVIAVPHTSWWDFFLGVFARGILNVEINFLAKKELFIFPFNYFFKWMGGAPLNRGKKENKVDAIAKVFSNKEVFRLAIAPEGTRKKVEVWRTGFYYMALKANIPIIPGVFDYGNKQVIFHKPFYPTGNINEDLKVLHSYYKGVKGKFPEKSFNL
ncbi:Acyltransferase [Flavobacterium sp. 9AF]|uniref:1-acyl-sn-glycerol-3-phosphate acyltransferase n=1 Tax=Flavobacterium sp. 9AF TaxID=2653142 RepID=UPI0012F18A7F|nr:1-acyl-sn-glycerol-3-phosphate acyltransferase [Flavobacterium sp. 9AF]VXA99687.1 Acyltransferase [Flavobacterium sp. 9AF]